MDRWTRSRYWNRLAFGVMRLGRRLVWDETGENGDLLADMDESLDLVRDVLTYNPPPEKKREKKC